MSSKSNGIYSENHHERSNHRLLQLHYLSRIRLCVWLSAGCTTVGVRVRTAMQLRRSLRMCRQEWRRDEMIPRIALTDGMKTSCSSWRGFLRSASSALLIGALVAPPVFAAGENAPSMAEPGGDHSRIVPYRARFERSP